MSVSALLTIAGSYVLMDRRWNGQNKHGGNMPSGMGIADLHDAILANILVLSASAGKH
jgi:hypothetical protein